MITWDERGFGQTEFDGKPFTLLGFGQRLPRPARPSRHRPRRRRWDEPGRLHLAAGRADRARARASADPARHPGRHRRSRHIAGATTQMRDTWLAGGPVDDLADVGGRTSSSPTRRSNPVWIAKWQARPKELLRAAVRHAHDPRRRHRSTRRDHLPGDRRSTAPRTRRSRWIVPRRSPPACRCRPGGQGRRRARGEPHESRPGQRGARRLPRLAPCLTPVANLQIFGVVGLPEIEPGAELADMIVDAAASGSAAARSRHRGRHVQDRLEGGGSRDRVGRRRAVRVRRTWGSRWDKDPAVVEVVLRESKRIVRQIGPVLITETHHGFICANSGVDQSSSGAHGRVLVLPRGS